jgi:hypothetical protein
MTINDLTDPYFHVTELSEEDFVIFQVASEALESGDAVFADQILRREADRDPKVYFRLFFSRAWA